MQLMRAIYVGGQSYIPVTHTISGTALRQAALGPMLLSFMGVNPLLRGLEATPISKEDYRSAFGS